MDHFDRIFEGGRGNGVSQSRPPEEEAPVQLRGHGDSPFRMRKTGPPDFDFVSRFSSVNTDALL